MDNAVQAKNQVRIEAGEKPLFFRPRALPCIAALLGVITFFGLIRYRLRGMPLERDEGEYALSGQLILQGIPPYKLAYNLKLPGTYAAYAAMMAVFGETPAGIHLGFLLVNALTSLLIYVLATRLFGRLAGVVAAASYALLSTGPSILGFQAHATHFIVLPAIVSILLLLQALESDHLWLFFASGLFSGIAFLMKQHGVFLVAFCFLYLVISARRAQRGVRDIFRYAAVFSAGVILPCAITFWLLYRASVFSQFWFWTVSYAREYSKMGLRRGVRTFIQNFHAVAAPTVLVWIFACIAIFARRWSPKARKHSWFLNSLWLFSFLAICPGVQFRPHYFVLLLPATALLAGLGVSSMTELLAQRQKAKYLVALPALAFLACFTSTIFEQRAVYFSFTPEAALRAAYPTQSPPFLAAEKIAQYVEDHSSVSSRLAIVGSEPEIYFYAHRLPATGYIYMYSLMEKQKYTNQMREQMIHEVESSRPEYLIYVNVWDSWGYQDAAAPHVIALLEWAQSYMREDYETVGVAEFREPIQYFWGDEAKAHVKPSYPAIYVMKRKN